MRALAWRSSGFSLSAVITMLASSAGYSERWQAGLSIDSIDVSRLATATDGSASDANKRLQVETSQSTIPSP